MEHGPWETNASSDITDFLRIMCNSNIHYRVHNTPPLIRLLCPKPEDKQKNSNLLKTCFHNFFIHKHTHTHIYIYIYIYIYVYIYIYIFKLFRLASFSRHCSQSQLYTVSFYHILSMTCNFNCIIIFLHFLQNCCSWLHRWHLRSTNMFSGL